MKKNQIQTKRVYDEPEDSDGYRVLVDRLWPRGIKKEALRHDLWLKEVTPSSSLRKWFHENTDQWAAFTQRYSAELDEQPEAVQTLIDRSRQQRITLLYAAKDEQHNNATVLRDYLLAHAK